MIRYAAVFGMSKENNVNSPIDFYTIHFNLNKEECERGIKGKYILCYVKQGKTEESTVTKLEKELYKVELRKDWYFKYIKEPLGYHYDGYVLKSQTHQIIY